MGNREPPFVAQPHQCFPGMADSLSVNASRPLLGAARGQLNDAGLDRAPTRDQVDYQYDDSYDQQDMNQVATDVTDEPQ